MKLNRRAMLKGVLAAPLLKIIPGLNASPALPTVVATVLAAEDDSASYSLSASHGPDEDGNPDPLA